MDERLNRNDTLSSVPFNVTGCTIPGTLHECFSVPPLVNPGVENFYRGTSIGYR